MLRDYVSQLSQQQRGRLYVALAAIAWSSAGVLQRELSVGAATQVAGRSLFAALGLIAYIAWTERGATLRAVRAIGIGGAGIVVLLAVASSSFFIALNHASVASVLFMQALAPLLAAALGTLLGDPVGRRTWIAMAIAFAGVAVMVGGPGRPSPLGIVLSLLMTVSFAATLVITRHRRDVSMAPATCLSQVLVIVVFGPFASLHGADAHDIGRLAALGIFQIGLGFALLTVGARLIPAGEVALISLLEVVLGPVWVWAILSESPSTATIIGGAIVIGALLLEARPDPPPTPV
jgi:drug/metabolite transporter (DMT)-like permease